MLLVVAGHFLVRHRLLRCKGINVNRGFADDALLSDQRRQLIRLAFEHEIGTRDAADKLLRSQLVTQGLRILVSSHPHLIDNRVVAVVIKLAIDLECRRGENGLLHLFIADAQFEFAGILVKQRFINQTIERLLAQGFHVTFVCRELRVLVAQLLLHAITFAVERILKLPTADFLVIHFSGVVVASANQVTTHAGQNERHDNDSENNLEHETVSSRA